MDERRTWAGPVVAANRVRLANDAVRIGAPLPPDAVPAPKIHLVREDGVIRTIEVTCKCGERTRIVCDYN